MPLASRPLRRDRKELSSEEYYDYKVRDIITPFSLTDSLPDGIHIVGDFEVRQDFLYLLDEVMWCKAHSVDIVGAADQYFCWSLQDLQSSPEAVIWTGGGGGGERDGGQQGGLQYEYHLES